MRIVVFALLVTLIGCSGGGGSPSRDSDGDPSPSPAITSAPTLEPTSAPSPTPYAGPTPAVTPAPSSEAEFYFAFIEPDIIQARCITCHVDDGLASATRLIYQPGSAAAVANRRVFDDFVASDDGHAQLMLNKVRGGDAHGGGSIFSSSSEQYQNLATYLEMITGAPNTGVPASATKFFEGVVLSDGGRTLRRAAVMLAGRLPTASERALAQNGDAGLRSAVRRLMQGEGFHDFLIRGANDRLLTDGLFNGAPFDITDGNFPAYELLVRRKYEEVSAGREDDYWLWKYRFTFGLARAPLELIAYVVENDRPYTEILTSDFMLANREVASMFDPAVDASLADTETFIPIRQRRTLYPGRVQGDFVQDVGFRIDANGGYVSYPHAGILNEPAFLARYPSTETNRNRARARWTFFHFLGVDIEKSASRTTDPVALADTNNPTLNNPNCTVCHELMDPVAGAFQNYGNEGWYRDSYEGLDSLPAEYKQPSDGSSTPYRRGDTWYRDMRVPGFDGQQAPSADNSLQWLASRVVDDSRFASASVAFWWPALMAEDLTPAPENSSDVGYAEQLARFEAQQAFIARLGTNFATGINGGSPFNLKDMLTELVLSEWFRAEIASAPLSTTRQAELTGVGAGRLLTPEELENKTRQLLGVTWREFPENSGYQIDGVFSGLRDQFRIDYGGIDAVGVTQRARTHNAVMSNVALSQALAVSCPAVVFDFERPAAERLLFREVERWHGPLSEAAGGYPVSGVGYLSRQTFTLQAQLPAGAHTLSVGLDNPFYDQSRQQGTNVVVHDIVVRGPNGSELYRFDGARLDSIPGAFFYATEDGPLSGPYFDAQENRETGRVFWAGFSELPITLGQSGQYRFEVTASMPREALSGRDAVLAVSVNASAVEAVPDDTPVRRALQYLHALLLGEELPLDSPELDADLQLFHAVWRDRVDSGIFPGVVDWDRETCEINDPGYWNTDRTDEFRDVQLVAGGWISMLTYFLTDYRYLYE